MIEGVSLRVCVCVRESERASEGVSERENHFSRSLTNELSLDVCCHVVVRVISSFLIRSKGCDFCVWVMKEQLW